MLSAPAVFSLTVTTLLGEFYYFSRFYSRHYGCIRLLWFFCILVYSCRLGKNHIYKYFNKVSCKNKKAEIQHFCHSYFKKFADARESTNKALIKSFFTLCRQIFVDLFYGFPVFHPLFNLCKYILAGMVSHNRLFGTFY